MPYAIIYEPIMNGKFHTISRGSVSRAGIKNSPFRKNLTGVMNIKVKGQ